MKKRVFIIVSSIVLVIAAVISVIFLLNTNDLEGESKEVSLVGTWRVFQQNKENQPLEYFVFDDATVTDYRDGSQTPYFISDYSIASSEITIDELELKFIIEKKEKDVILLIRQELTYHLTRVSNLEYQNPTTYSTGDFSGTYDVILHAETPTYNEFIVFENNIATFNRGESVILETEFTVENNILDCYQLSFIIINITETKMFFAEIDAMNNYYVWSLVRR